MKRPDETERGFNELPACVAEFIRLIIQKMRYSKQVREDVQSELAAHFEDELKDYGTDEEREQQGVQERRL